jgi:hypothetical protein
VAQEAVRWRESSAAAAEDAARAKRKLQLETQRAQLIRQGWLDSTPTTTTTTTPPETVFEALPSELSLRHSLPEYGDAPLAEEAAVAAAREKADLEAAAEAEAAEREQEAAAAAARVAEAELQQAMQEAEAARLEAEAAERMRAEAAEAAEAAAVAAEEAAARVRGLSIASARFEEVRVDLSTTVVRSARQV